MTPRGFICPAPLDGDIGEISLVVPEQRLGDGGQVEIVCCNSRAGEEVCGPSLFIEYLPEPSGTLMLLVGAVALWGVSRCRR